MRSGLMLIVLIGCLLALAQGSSMDDSLFRRAQVGSSEDMLRYMDLYQKDNPERVQLILGIWNSTNEIDQRYFFKHCDLLLDIAKWSNKKAELKKYKNLAVTLSLAQSDTQMLNYFEYKSWCLEHKQDYEAIRERSIAFKAQLRGDEPHWFRYSNLSLLSYAYSGLEKYDSAILYRQSALSELSEGNDFQKVNTLRQLAYLSSIIEDDETAFNNLSEAIAIAEHYEFRRSLSHLYLMAGRVQLKNEEVVQAIKLLKKSQAIEKEDAEFSYYPYSSVNVGIAYKQLGLLDSALYAFGEARKYNVNERYLSEIFLNEINIHIEKEQWNKAREQLVKCMKLADDNSMLKATVYQNFAYIAYKQEDYGEAIRQGDLAEAIFLSSTQSSKNLLDLYATLQQSYEAMGLYRSAYEVLEKATKVKETYTNELKQKAKVNYEVKQNLREIKEKQLLSEAELVRSKQLVKSRNWLLLALAIAIILSCIAVYLFFKRRELQYLIEVDRVNMELAYQEKRFKEIESEWEQNLKKGISEELHDNILSALSGIRLLSESMQIHIAETNNEELILTQQKEHEALKQVYHELRTYVDDLRLNMNVGLQSNVILDLADFIKTFLDPSGITVKIESDLGTRLEKVPDKLQLVLVRVVKETLTNILKHSKANKCFVKLKWDGDLFAVSIYDNGVGYISENLKRKSGLNNIEQRVRNVGGKIEILSKEGEGTLVDLEFKLD